MINDVLYSSMQMEETGLYLRIQVAQ